MARVIKAGDVDLQALFRRVATRGGLKELGPADAEWCVLRCVRPATDARSVCVYVCICV